MKIANQPEPVRILVSTACLLVLINFFAWRLNAYLGVVVLPFATFAIALAAVRISAPWYVKRKTLKFIEKHNGRADLDQLVLHLAPAERPGVDGESARDVVRVFIQGMEEDGLIRITDSGEVIKADWGRMFT